MFCRLFERVYPQVRGRASRTSGSPPSPGRIDPTRSDELPPNGGVAASSPIPQPHWGCLASDVPDFRGMGAAARAMNTSFRINTGVQIMARMAFAAARADVDGALVAHELSLVPTEAGAASGWSIDEEIMGTGWHDSSWMLKKGLDVIEGVPSSAIPPEWILRWWAASVDRSPALPS